MQPYATQNKIKKGFLEGESLHQTQNQGAHGSSRVAPPIPSQKDPLAALAARAALGALALGDRRCASAADRANLFVSPSREHKPCSPKPRPWSTKLVDSVSNCNGFAYVGPSHRNTCTENTC